MKPHAAFTFLALFAVLLPAAPADAPVRWGGVEFPLPTGFAGPQKLGLDAVSWVHPDGREVSLVAIPREMMEAMGTDEAGLRDYVLTTFFGAGGKDRQPLSRDWRGKPISGERVRSSIPRPQTIDLLLLPLKAGGWLAVGLSAPDHSAAATLDRLADGLLSGLRELPSD